MPRPCAGKQSVGRREAENQTEAFMFTNVQHGMMEQSKRYARLSASIPSQVRRDKRARPGEEPRSRNKGVKQDKKKSIAYMIEYFERKEATILSGGKKSCKIYGYKTSRTSFFEIPWRNSS